MSDGVALTNVEHPTKASIQIGRYSVWESGDEIGIIDLDTGEAGVFPKSEFLPYVEAFFGLNYD
jgi:hypothetical protein